MEYRGGLVASPSTPLKNFFSNLFDGTHADSCFLVEVYVSESSFKPRRTERVVAAMCHREKKETGKHQKRETVEVTHKVEVRKGLVVLVGHQGFFLLTFL